MSLKLSKKTKSSKNLENKYSDSDALTACTFSVEKPGKQISDPELGINLAANDNCKSFQSSKIENCNATPNKTVNISNGTPDKKRDYITIDEDELEGTKDLQGCSKHNYKDRDLNDIACSKPSLAKLETMSATKSETLLQGKCSLAEPARVDVDIDMTNNSAGPMDEDVTLQTTINQPVVNIRKESPFTLSNSGMMLFEFGRYLF